MNRRLACVDIPHSALQFFLRDVPEWMEYPVVLLDRDEAGGRVIDLNQNAAGLGIGKGMRYGPCLGIHRNLKGGVIAEGECRKWQERILGILQTFSPFVEQAWFDQGTYWMDASGLSHLYGSVKTWLTRIHEAVTSLGLECGLSAGSGRFATYAAARMKPMGDLNIFSDEKAESDWIGGVPVEILSMNDEALKLFKRLRILTVGDARKLPQGDIGRRLSSEAGRILAFIRDERVLPLQYAPEEHPAFWRIRPDEPLERTADLIEAGGRLIDLCIGRAGRDGSVVSALEITLTAAGSVIDASVKPACPTRDGDRLRRLLASRIEYLDISRPVHEIQCRGFFCRPGSGEVSLFEADHHRHRREAEAVLAALQSERGPECVLQARICEDSLPTAQYRLIPWAGFPPPSARASRKPADAPAADISCRGKAAGTLIRRICFNPLPSRRPPDPASRVVYSGGWWSRPYQREFGYHFSGGRLQWLQRSEDDGGWKLIGWVD